EPCLRSANQSVVAHDLLCVSGQLPVVRLVNHADVPGHERNAVLSTLFVPTSGPDWKSIIRSIGCATGSVYHYGRVLNASAFSVSDEDLVCGKRNGRRI